MADFRVTIRGADRIAAALGGDLLDAGLRPGFTKAGVIVEGAWKEKVHVVTRKSQGSIQSDVQGEGASLQARVGPRPGYSQPRRYTKAQTRHWKKPRDGVNRGDPREYLVYEDQGTRFRPGHPAAEPALEENVGRIADVIGTSFEREVKKRWR